MESPRHDVDAVVVICMFPSEALAAEVARDLVATALAACVNIVAGARSIYQWQGEICDEAEVLAVIKTTASRFEALRQRLVEAHPYDCPEVLALPVSAGHRPYLDWVASTCTEKPCDS